MMDLANDYLNKHFWQEQTCAVANSPAHTQINFTISPKQQPAVKVC